MNSFNGRRSREILSRFLCFFLVILMSCGDPVDIPDGTPDEIARHLERFVQYRQIERSDDTQAATITDNDLLIRPVEDLAQQLYLDCQQQGHTPNFEGMAGAFEPDLTDCPAWDNDAERPSVPTTCTQAVCNAVASLCVAERLAETADQVQNYQSGRYEFGGGAKRRSLVVPPQRPRANAALWEAAADWTARAIEMAGENLRTGLAVQTTPDGAYDGVCTATGTSRMWLSHADNVLSDPFGELSNVTDQRRRDAGALASCEPRERSAAPGWFRARSV